MTADLTMAGPLGQHFTTERFSSLAYSFWKWRNNPHMRLMDKTKDKGRVLQFVKGLRLSAEIAHIMRNVLSDFPSLEVNWGHLIDENGVSCSPECDIIVHKRGQIERWVDQEPRIMDFRFVRCDNAVAVVSCKSFKKSLLKADKEYRVELKKYKVDNLFLIAECCKTSRVNPLRNDTKNAGYRDFFYLYSINKDQSTIATPEPDYVAFAESLRAIAARAK